MTLKRRLLISAVPALLGLSGAAIAQDRPGFLAEFPVNHIGTFNGFDAWKVENQTGENVWFSIPGSNMIVTGYAFDLDGNDLTAEMQGVSPVDAWKTAGLERGAAEENVIWSGIEGIVSPAELGAAQGLHQDVMQQTDQVLSNIPDERKREVISDLVASMNAAETPAQFQLALVDWTERTSGKPAMTGEQRKALEALAALSPEEFAAAHPSIDEQVKELDPAVPTASVVQTPEQEDEGASKAMPPPETPLMKFREGAAAVIDPAVTAGEIPSPQPAVAYAGEVPEVSPASSEPGDGAGEAFFKQIEADSYWFSIGKADAKIVYMFADPMCPYCGKAINTLKADVEAGKLQLRIIMAPLVSQRSPTAIAGILLSENPAQAYWEHSLDFGSRGSSKLAHSDFSNLPDDVNARVKTNWDMFKENQIPAVPFFAWQGNKGYMFKAGVPVDGYFDDKF